MGKSAKLHKRVPKKARPSAPPAGPSDVQHAQKKATRKNKIANAKGGKVGGPVLGGADYVTLMLGGRRKAKEEAIKLPVDEDT